MRDLENIDLDLLDHVTGGCGGGQPAQPTPVTETSTSGLGGTNRAATIGFLGLPERPALNHFGPAVGLGHLGGAMAALDSADAPATPADAGPGSIVCGVTPAAGADAHDAGPVLGAFGHDRAGAAAPPADASADLNPADGLDGLLGGLPGLADGDVDVQTDFGDLHFGIEDGQVSLSFGS